MANRNLATTITIGGAVSGALSAAIGSTQSKLRDLGNAVRALKAQQAELARTTGTATVQYQRLTAQVDRLRAAQSRLAQIERQRQANLQNREDLRGQMGDALAVGATVAFPVIQAAQFERSMLGVAKQVEGARDASGQLTSVYYEMREQIFGLSRELPIATGEIAEMVAAGARMGVAKDALIDFTRTSAMMASAFELPAGELAEQMGKVANLFGIPITNIGALADSINFLDDNAQSKGGDIIEVLQRIAGQAQTLKMSAQDAAALGSTFLSLGASAEIAATGANAVMRELAIATMQPERFQEGLAAIGMNAADVQSRMSRDATGTILAVMDALNKLPDEKRLEATTRLFGKEYGDDVAKLAGNVREYRRQLEMANSEAAKGSMAREAAAVRDSTLGQWQIFKNRLSQLSIVIGDVLLPPLNKLMFVIGEAATKVAAFAKANPVLTQAVVTTAAALGALKVAAIAGGYAFTFLKGAYLQVAGVIARARAGAALAQVGASAGTAVSWLTRLTSVLGMVGNTIAAIGAGPVLAIGAVLVATAVAIYKYWDWVKAFFIGFGQGVMDALGPVFTELQTALEPIKPAIEWIARGFGIMWDAIVQFLQPVTATKEELEGATSAGRTFGLVVGSVLGTLVDMITAPIRLFVALGEGIGTAAGWLHEKLGGAITMVTGLWPTLEAAAVMAWEGIKAKVGAIIDALLLKIAPLMNGIAWIGEKASALGGMLGLGGDAPAPAAAGGAPLPQPQMRGASGGTTTNSPTYNITVQQQPGQDNRALAAEIDRKMREREQQRQRGALYDGVAP